MGAGKLEVYLLVGYRKLEQSPDFRIGPLARASRRIIAPTISTLGLSIPSTSTKLLFRHSTDKILFTAKSLTIYENPEGKDIKEKQSDQPPAVQNFFINNQGPAQHFPHDVGTGALRLMHVEGMEDSCMLYIDKERGPCLLDVETQKVVSRTWPNIKILSTIGGICEARHGKCAVYSPYFLWIDQDKKNVWAANLFVDKIKSYPMKVEGKFEDICVNGGKVVTLSEEGLLTSYSSLSHSENQFEVIAIKASSSRVKRFDGEKMLFISRLEGKHENLLVCGYSEKMRASILRLVTAKRLLTQGKIFIPEQPGHPSRLPNPVVSALPFHSPCLPCPCLIVPLRIEIVEIVLFNRGHILRGWRVNLGSFAANIGLIPQGKREDKVVGAFMSRSNGNILRIDINFK